MKQLLLFVFALLSIVLVTTNLIVWWIPLVMLHSIYGIYWAYLFCFCPGWTLDLHTQWNPLTAISLPKRWYRIAQTILSPIWEVGLLIELSASQNQSLREQFYEIE